MLKAIKFYLLDDEEQQSSLEVESAYAIKKNKEKKPDSLQTCDACYLCSVNAIAKHVYICVRQ